jgi:ribosomal protein L29
MSSKVEEYRNMDEDELDGRLAQAKQELFNLRFQVVTGQLDNTSRIGRVKRDVARIRTVLREREIEAAETLAAAGPAAPEAVERVRHPRYDKTVQRTKRLYAHDEANQVKVGDRVRLSETRPMSKLKRWRIVEVLERAK